MHEDERKNVAENLGEEDLELGATAAAEVRGGDGTPVQTMSMYSKIIQASNDMKKAIIANFRV